MYWKSNLFVSLLFVTAVKHSNSTVVLPADFSGSDNEMSTASDEIAAKYSQEYMSFTETGIESDDLKDLSTQLSQTHGPEIFTRSMTELEAAERFFTCTTCRITVDIFVRILRITTDSAQAEDLSRKAFSYLCSSLKIQTAEVCTGLFNLNWHILYYVFQNSKADPRTICGALPISFCQVMQPEFNYKVTIDSGKGPLMASKAAIPQKTKYDATVLHLTDIHCDLEYLAGSMADCNELMCCRATSTGKGMGKEGNESKAGYWGDYRSCDIPLYTVENAFDHIGKTQQKIDYIYHTGDIVPHNIWSTTREGVKTAITQINRLVAEKFPGIPVYPCVGNHETHPVNVFGHENLPSEFQSGWLYEHLWTEWQRWLPPTTRDTILQGGYYTVSPKPGFRIISLHNIDCYLFNWWIYYDGNNYTSLPQLEWLHDTLLSAEKSGEYVHILAHIPSGDSECWSVWSREYNRLIERFSNTIGGIFNGHTHRDEWEVHYSAKGYAMGISWNGGSLTAHKFKNPNYRIYEVETKTYQVVDHSTWIFNLTEANVHGEGRSPNWFKEYQFSEFTNNFSPAGIDALLDKMAANPDILRQYWRYKIVSSDPRLSNGCNNDCLLETICSLATSVYNEKPRCKALQEKLKESLDATY